jgi:hypothetical protein
MTAGTNVYFDIYRMESASDDIVGGAQVTGTLIYEHIPGRMKEQEPEQLMLQQGVEVTKIFDILLVDKKPIGMDIREKDEVEVVAPYNHHFLSNRFRAIGVRSSSLNPSNRRANLLITATRSERAHANQ